MADLAAALDAAGRAGVVHRDVKPENVLIESGSGRALLADFGIARAMVVDGASSTGQGVAVGTPSYMSPEQAAGEEVDSRSDLYGLGVVAYEMLAGHPPFQGTNRVVVSKHIAERPVPIERRPARLPAAAGRRGDEGAGETAGRAVAERRGAAPGGGGRAGAAGEAGRPPYRGHRRRRSGTCRAWARAWASRAGATDRPRA